MSTKSLCLPAVSREESGKADVRRMRRNHDTMPAVIYGAKKKPQSIAIEHRHMLRALMDEAVYSQILELDVDGKKEKVVLKALQRHPYKQIIMHADFLRVSAKEKLHMHIPLHFINEENSPGSKQGGVFTHTLNEVEVSCLPAALPEFIEVDLANIELDGSVHLSELVMPEGVELVALAGETPHDSVVASVHMPKQQAEPEADADQEAGSGEEESGEAGDSNAAAEGSADGQAAPEGAAEQQSEDG